MNNIAGRWSIVAALFVLAGASSILVATAAFGPATTPDSAHYLAAADSFVRTGQFLGYDGRPMVYWPPLYPAVLGAFDRLLPGGTLDAARLGGVVLFVLASVLFLALARRSVSAVGAYLFAAAGWGLSTTHLLMFGAALSEGLFIVCVLLAALAITQPPDRLRSITVCIALAAACLTRYIGVSVCAAFVLVELLRTRTVRGAIAAGLTGAVAVVPLGLWMLRNRLAGGEADARPDAMVGLLENARSGVDVVTQFLFPAAVPFPVRLLALLAVAALAIRRHRRNTSAAAAVTMTTVALVGACYFVILLALARLTYVDTFDFRLMSPLCPLLLLTAAYALDGALTSTGRNLRGCGAAVAAGLLVFAGFRAFQFAERGHRDGPGMYTSREWRGDAGLHKLADTGGEPLFSNAPDAVFINTGLCVRMLPLARTASLRPLPATFRLHWQKDFWRTYTIAPADLADRCDLRVLHDDARGTLYRVTEKSLGPETAP